MSTKYIFSDITCSGENEEVFKCGACDSDCNEPIRACPLLCRAPECGCSEGYVRNRKGRCVKPEQCNSASVEPVKHTCATILCTAGTECQHGKCVKVKDLDPCAAILCAANSSCVNGTCVKNQQRNILTKFVITYRLLQLQKKNPATSRNR